MGRAGVEVRPNSVRVTFTYEGRQQRRTLILNGKPLEPSPANLKYAERLAAEIREKIRLGSFSMAEYFPVSGDTGEAVTVGAQLDSWKGAQRLEASTLAGYSSAIKFWKAKIGDLPLRTLKHSEILKVIADRPELTGKTVNNYVSVLREAFDMAIIDGEISKNPVADVPRAKHQKPPVDPFSREEAEAILAYMGKHYPEPILNFTEYKFFTGVRTSESFGLPWGNVDLASSYMLVSDVIVRGVEKDRTKTNVARQVILNSRALGALQRQAKHTRMAGKHVFLDPRYGTPWLEERAYRRSYWTPALKALGIRYRPPYNTRHTCATIMLMAGMTPAFCAKQLGHSVEMFLKTYSKWLDGDQNDLEMQRMEAALAGKLSLEKATLIA